MTSLRLGISLPKCLTPGFDETWDLAQRALGERSRAYRLFHMGWHGVGYRAVTLAQYATRYSRLPTYGSAGHEGNFLEDQALVDYLFNACSAVDCLVFAAFGIGAGLDPISFPSDKAGQLQMYRKDVADLFKASWPNEDLTSLLVHLRDNPGIRLLFEVRDVVTHRGTLPRTLYVGGRFDAQATVPSNVKELPDVWTSDLPIGSASVADWQSSLEQVLTRAVAGILSFPPLQPATRPVGVDA